MVFDQIYTIAVPQRRAYIVETLAKVGIFPRLFPAILTETLDFDALIRDGYMTAIADGPRNLRRVACNLSHLSVLRLFLADRGAQSCLIFEDDIAPPAADVAERVAAAAAALPARWDILYLGRCGDTCDADVPVGDSQLVRCFAPLCRHAYAVSRRGARILLDAAFPMHTTFGDRMHVELIQQGVLRAYCCKPALFHQNREQLGSTLGHRMIFLPECAKKKN